MTLTRRSFLSTLAAAPLALLGDGPPPPDQEEICTQWYNQTGRCNLFSWRGEGGRLHISGRVWTPPGTPMDPNYWNPLPPAPGMRRLVGTTDPTRDGWLLQAFHDVER